MRLALFVSAPRGGGAQRRLRRLAPAFPDAGLAVELVTAAGPAEDSGWDARIRHDDLGVAAGGLPGLRHRRGLRVPLALPALTRYLDEAQPDVLLSTSLPANLTALLAARRSRHRPRTMITLNLHTSARLAALGAAGRLLAPFVKDAYRQADAIVAIWSGVAEDARAFLAPAAPPEFTVCNPIDADTVRARAAAEPEIPLPRQRPLLVACGKLAPQKDFATLLHAFARLRAQRPASLLILGEGGERRRLTRLAQRLGIAADVRLPGFVENPFAVFARADLFVLSSRFEGSSNVLLEALACGCRIVSADCPSGPREILEDGRFGPLVPVGDADALAHAIGQVLDHPPDPDLLRARARFFAVDAAIDRYLAVLDRCIRARAAARFTRIPPWPIRRPLTETTDAGIDYVLGRLGMERADLFRPFAGNAAHRCRLAAMIARLGIDPHEAVTRAWPELREADLRCSRCPAVRACSEWLRQPRPAEAPPGFCPNAGLLSALRRPEPVGLTR